MPGMGKQPDRCSKGKSPDSTPGLTVLYQKQVNVSYIFLISNKKTCKLLVYRSLRFRIVAESSELSNQKLFNDMVSLVKLDEDLY